jgi:hypothetical protein
VSDDSSLPTDAQKTVALMAERDALFAERETLRAARDREAQARLMAEQERDAVWLEPKVTALRGSSRGAPLFDEPMLTAGMGNLPTSLQPSVRGYRFEPATPWTRRNAEQMSRCGFGC